VRPGGKPRRARGEAGEAAAFFPGQSRGCPVLTEIRTPAPRRGARNPSTQEAEAGKWGFETSLG
jgi:hypothetical protein